MKARYVLLLALSIALVAVAQPSRAEFKPLDPCRVLDTREPGEGPAIIGGSVRAINVRGVCGIPPSATAVMFNVTVVSGGGAGYLTLYPGDRVVPTASTVNFEANDVRNNNATVRLADGQAELGAFVRTNPASKPVHLILDVAGYHAGSMAAVAARVFGENFTVDRWTNHGNGTASDRVTGLQWELKTKDGGIHDWSGNTNYAFSSQSFINALNTSPCFAGHCDWRLPTADELQSMSEPGHPNCSAPPCTAIPGETASGPHWTSTATGGGTSHWVVDFSNGLVHMKLDNQNAFVRAVRDGTK